MADEDETEKTELPVARRGMGMKGWLATVGIAVTLGAAGFIATFSGFAESLLHPNAHGGASAAEIETPQFLELDPMMVTVGGGAAIRQLRFRAFLQVGPEGKAPVAALQPRILDIFATYLRAVSVERLEDPTALLQLRAQLLRRVQLLVGADAVTDLLIIDFVIA